jgi:hypothetical protein
MANWRKTKTPGVYVAHQVRCSAFDDHDARCRCEPSWRGRRRHPVTGKAEWQKPVAKNRSEVLSWLGLWKRGALGIWKRGASHAREQAKASRIFESIGDEWLDGVKAGRISRRKGRSRPYSPTTLRDYTTAYRNFLRPEFGPFPADDIGELEWQMWCDRLSREGLRCDLDLGRVGAVGAQVPEVRKPARRLPDEHLAPVLLATRRAALEDTAADARLDHDLETSSPLTV